MDIDALVSITDTIDTYMYTYFLVFLLIGAGLYFTIRTKGVQFTHIKDMFRAITEKKHVEGGKSVSSFQAMMVSTASRVGTGNIAGVATAIAVGGPSAAFAGPRHRVRGGAHPVLRARLQRAADLQHELVDRVLL